MKEKELIDIWKREESVAHIHGWDFSHIEGRYTEETDLPWNYQNIILDYLKPDPDLSVQFMLAAWYRQDHFCIPADRFRQCIIRCRITGM